MPQTNKPIKNYTAIGKLEFTVLGFGFWVLGREYLRPTTCSHPKNELN
jgi:hypothetical protein